MSALQPRSMSTQQCCARYAVTFGLSGCYLPDYHGAAVEITTRRDLASCIRDELDILNLPKSAIRQVPLRRLWRHIKRHGSSSAHFSIHHGNNVLEFHGLTEAEYQQQQQQECD